MKWVSLKICRVSLYHVDSLYYHVHVESGVYLLYLDVSFDVWLCQMNLKMPLGSLDVGKGMASPPCGTACEFSGFLALKTPYCILGTEGEKWQN